MAYDLQISGADAKVLTPDQEIISGITEGIIRGSSILPLMNRLPNMTTGTAYFPVLDVLPQAYFVDEGIDNGRKQTTNQAWKDKKIFAQEIAVIVPIKKNVLSDAKYDIWGQVRPRIVESAYKLIDEAILLGKNKPALWREGLIPSIINVGADIAPATDNTYTQISKAMTKVEESGYDVTGLLGGVSLKGAFREGLLDSTGQPLASTSEVMQLPRVYASNGAWDNSLAKFIVGDFRQAVYAIREDVTFELFDTGVISDKDGKIIYNLLQDDMVALRFTMRLGWEIPNPINILEPNEEKRFPFALVEPSVAPTDYTVTFTVQDDEASNVENAVVNLNGQSKKTNNSGKVTFKSLGNSSYVYVITKRGYSTTSGEFKVATEAKDLTVTLPKNKPVEA